MTNQTGRHSANTDITTQMTQTYIKLTIQTHKQQNSHQTATSK